MGHLPVELTFEECVQGLSACTVGRVALALPDGPRIVPVNYTVHDGAVIIRTSPHSELASYGVGAMLAFEVDTFDTDLREGWSVVARGRAARVEDPDELSVLQGGWDPEPWAAGVRSLYLRLPWQQLSGRRLGGGWRGRLPSYSSPGAAR